MRQHFSSFVHASLAVAFAMLLSSCGGDSSTGPGDDKQGIAHVTVSAPVTQL